MRIGIVGATGQLGKLTVNALLVHGVPATDITALVRTPAKASPLATQGIEIRRADYDDPEGMTDAFRGIDRLLLIPSLAAPAQRCVQHQNAIDSAKSAGVSHLYFYSLISAHPDAPFLITPFLLFAESALRTSGLNWTILRNPMYADPIIEWVPEIVKMGTIPYPTRDGASCYAAREDLASAAAGALAGSGHENKVYKLTGPESLTTADLCRIISRVTGNPVVYKHATDEQYIEAGRASGDSETMIRYLLTLYHTVAEGFFDQVTRDIESLSGKPPQTFATLLQRSDNS